MKQVLLISFLSIFSGSISAQTLFYQDEWIGGATASGGSPGAYATFTPSDFEIYIPPGSTIRKAWLFAGRHGFPSSTEVDLNGNVYTFNMATQVSEDFYSLYGDEGAVHAIEVTDDIDPGVSDYTLEVLDTYFGPSNIFLDFYLVVLYDNPDLDSTFASIYLNDQDFDDGVDPPWEINLSRAMDTTECDIGLAFMTGYACFMSDGEEAYVDGSYIGTWGGNEPNSGDCGGPLGSFTYFDKQLTGLMDDDEDEVVDETDVVATINDYITPGSTYLELNFDYVVAAFGESSNAIWLAVVLNGYTAEPNDTIQISLCEGDSYLLPGGDLTEDAGIYTDSLIAMDGTDSVIVTEITVIETVFDAMAVSICDGESFTLPGGEIVEDAGIYIDTILSAAGCDSVVTTTLILHPIYIVPVNAVVCSGDSYTLPDGVVVDDPGVYISTLTGFFGCDSNIVTTLSLSDTFYVAVDVAVCEGETYTLPDGVVIDAAGVYISELTAASGCDSTIQTTISYFPPTPIEFTVIPQICLEDASILLSATPAGGIFSGDGVTGNEFDPFTAGAGSHEIFYAFSDPDGCTTIVSAFIEVLENIVDAGPDISYDEGSSGTLNGITGGDYAWAPPDGLDCIDCPAPGVSIQTTTTYTLSSIDANGCTGTDDVLVTVNIITLVDIFVPNTFTPNGDGINDLFTAYGSDLEMIEEFQVYDRWGELVYASTEIAPFSGDGWDGYFNGDIVNQGVYAYVILARLNTGTKQLIKGNVTVVR